VKAKVVNVEDDPLVADPAGDDVATHDQLPLFATVCKLSEARELLNRGVDLLILDLRLSDGNGIDLIEEIRCRHGAAPKILVLTVLGDQETVLAAVLAGADGCLLKDQSSIDIGQQAANALTGGAPLSPTVAAYALRDQPKHTKAEAREPDLSPREFELLQLLAHGHSNRQAADALSLSPHTVGDHVKSIYRKLGVSSRAEAMARAFRSGLLRS
jgi:DNA-binding NarL/FixJ family response regulator